MANNPYTNKVIINNSTVIDLSADTVDASHLASGYTAHDASGAAITGTMTGKQMRRVDLTMNSEADLGYSLPATVVVGVVNLSTSMVTEYTWTWDEDSSNNGEYFHAICNLCGLRSIELDANGVPSIELVSEIGEKPSGTPTPTVGTATYSATEKGWATSIKRQLGSDASIVLSNGTTDELFNLLDEMPTNISVYYSSPNAVYEFLGREAESAIRTTTHAVPSSGYAIVSALVTVTPVTGYPSPGANIVYTDWSQDRNIPISSVGSQADWGHY